jgi:hypothetical protein
MSVNVAVSKKRSRPTVRFLVVAVSIMLLSQSFADCLPRMNALNADDETPVFVLLSCRPALDYILENKNAFRVQFGYDNAISWIVSSDLAVEVRPSNSSAVSTMHNKEGEVWHYSGSCDELPLGKPVILEIIEHCSDAGLTKFAFLNDVTIKRFTLIR